MSDSGRQKVIDSIFGAGTGPHYDRIVEFSTGGLDKIWKDALLAKVGQPVRILDLACGTGILTFRLHERFPKAEIVGVDLTEEYLDVARARVQEAGLQSQISFLHSPAEEAELTGKFDLVITSYLPKYADLPKLMGLLRQHTDSGAQILMHDFTYPKDPVVARYLTWRFIRLRDWAKIELPEAVGMFENLPSVVQESNWVEDIEREMAAHGFGSFSVEYLDQRQAAIVEARAE